MPAPQPGGVLALDLARCTGWAYCYPGEAPVSGEWMLPPVLSWGMQVTALQTALWELVDQLSPRLLAYEAAIRYAHDGANVAKTAFGLAAAVEGVAYQAEAECISAPPSTTRKTVLSDGAIPRAIAKQTILRFVQERGWPAPGHNAGDALIVLAWACRARNLPGPYSATPFDGLRWWRPMEFA